MLFKGMSRSWREKERLVRGGRVEVRFCRREGPRREREFGKRRSERRSSPRSSEMMW